jgi:hypothetical protein
MADVIVVFAREDWAFANTLADALKLQGIDVWWNRDLASGDQAEQELAEHLAKSRAVIVIWSEAAAASSKVLTHAESAHQSGKLIGTLVSGFRPERLAPQFQRHHIDAVSDVPKIIKSLEQIEGRTLAASEPSITTDVFVSYARKDWTIANAVVDELRARDFTVWIDRDLVAGKPYERQIEERLAAAKAVVVIWSENSARSSWVLGEAERAQRDRKLVPTRLPTFKPAQIPAQFQSDEVELVNEMDGIVSRLARKGANPRALSGSINKPKKGNRVNEALSVYKRAQSEQVSFFLPIVIFFATMIFGVGLVAVANSLEIGFVNWRPDSTLVKEVGYISALNWSFTSVVLFPPAWALGWAALEKLWGLPRQMIFRRMIVTKDLEPITENDPGVVRLLRDVRRITILLMVSMTALAIWFAIDDFHTSVYKVYTDPALRNEVNNIAPDAKFGLRSRELERDWSIAALLKREDQAEARPTQNLWFAFIVYLIYAGIGIGLMFSFLVALVGIGMFFLPAATDRYGILVMPDMESADRRRGLEMFAGFFGNATSIVLLSLCACYLMFLQNLYMRVKDPSLASFLSPDFASALGHASSGALAEVVNDLIGNALAPSMRSTDIQSLMAWIVASILPIVLVGIAYASLRRSAKRGRRIALREIDRGGMSAILQITDLPKDQVRARLQDIQFWPLDWPSLRQVALAYLLVCSTLVFYKLGFLILLATIAFVAYYAFHSEEGD